MNLSAVDWFAFEPSHTGFTNLVVHVDESTSARSYGLLGVVASHYGFRILSIFNSQAGNQKGMGTMSIVADHRGPHGPQRVPSVLGRSLGRDLVVPAV